MRKMKVEKRSLRLRMVFILVCVMVIAAILIVVQRSMGKPDAVFGDYSITMGDNTYSTGTQTGRIDLTIKSSGTSFEKLFYTSEDVLHNGFDFIVDDEYTIQISYKSDTLLCRAHETGYEKKTQTLSIYYICNEGVMEEGDSVNVEVVKSQEKKIKVKVPVKVKRDKEYLSSYGNTLIVSATGIKYKDLAMYSPTIPVSATMTIKWAGRERQMAVRSGNTADYKPKVSDSDESYDGYRTYVIELPEWKEIRSIQLGSAVYDLSEEGKALAEQEMKEQKAQILGYDSGSERKRFTGEKEEIMEKMLNAVDYYTTVQGRFRIKSQLMGGDSEAEIEYKADKEQLYSYENVDSDEFHYTAAADKEKTTMYFHDQKGYRYVERSEESDTTQKMEVDERVRSTENGNDFYRNNILDLYYAEYSIYPQTTACYYMYVPSQWELASEEKIAGRSCWKVEGEVSLEPVRGIAMWIDKETGCLLQYKGYDEDGKETEYLITDEISYDAEVTPVKLEGKFRGYKNLGL